jgi:hypothetical protein
MKNLASFVMWFTDEQTLDVAWLMDSNYNKGGVE